MKNYVAFLSYEKYYIQQILLLTKHYIIYLIYKGGTDNEEN